MNLPSKLLVGAFILLLVVLGAWKYHEFFIERNFTIYNETECDPTEESCFIYGCAEDDECRDYPYKKIEILAAYAPLCDEYSQDDCESLSCEGVSSEYCTEYVCSEDTLEEDEECYFIEPEIILEEVISEESDQEVSSESE